MKSVVVGLDRLKYLNSGLGQVSKYFGNALSKLKSDKLNITFIIPKEYKGNTENFRFIEIFNIFRKNNIHLFQKKYDLWHIIHQTGTMEPPKGVKSILTIHDLNFLKEKKDALKQKIYLYKLKNKIQKSTYLTYISEFTKNEVETHIPISKSIPSKVIYNGIKVAKYENALKPNYIKQRKFFFTIGQVLEKKNFHVLVSLMEKLKDYDLIIAGENHFDYGEKIQKDITKNNLEDRVRLVGPISEEDKSYLYDNCEAFFFPSKHEGFGMPIIEAMHFNKPVFCSNLSSLPEIGGSLSYYWNNFDPDYMYKVLMEGLDDFNSNQKEIIQLYKNHISKFSWDTNSKEYMEIYEELLEQK